MARMFGNANLEERIRDETLIRAWCGGLSASNHRVAKPDSRSSTTMDLTQQTSVVFSDLYQVDGRLGQGAFGVVIRGRHVASGRACCVKVIGKSTAGNDYHKRVIEGGIWDTLMRMSVEMPHPKILQYYDLLDGSKHYFAPMECLEGKDLAAQVEEDSNRFPITERYCQGVLSQVLAALAHLHDSVGIIHRDIKFENFRYRSKSKDSDLVLIDFGLPRFIGEDHAGNTGGTPLYLAPEILRGMNSCTGVDVWAAGVMLFVLLATAMPFDEDEANELGKGADAGQITLNGSFAFLDPLPLSDEVVRLQKSMLSYDSNARPSASQALQDPWFSMSGAAVERQLRDKLFPIQRHMSVSSLASLLKEASRQDLSTESKVKEPPAQDLSIESKVAHVQSGGGCLEGLASLLLAH